VKGGYNTRPKARVDRAAGEGGLKTDHPQDTDEKAKEGVLKSKREGGSVTNVDRPIKERKLKTTSMKEVKGEPAGKGGDLSTLALRGGSRFKKMTDEGYNCLSSGGRRAIGERCQKTVTSKEGLDLSRRKTSRS